MSSFNVNGPSSNQPMVTGSQNLGKDGGGGGSTGYMHMRKKKKSKSSSSEEDNSVFLEEESFDSFEKSDDKKAPENKKFLGAISNFIKEKITPDPKDSFEKSETTDENAPQEETEYPEYNIPLKKTIDPLEDDEYEIADDDDYYNNIDV